MANLTLAQDVVRRLGTPRIQAALQTLVDPFRSVDALPLSLSGALQETPVHGMPAPHLLLRAAAHLQPPPSPGWSVTLPAAVELATAQPSWPAVTTGSAFLSAWLKRLRIPSGVTVDWRSLQTAAAIPGCAVDVLCAVTLSPLDPPEAAMARGALLDRMEARSLDGAGAVLALESALLGTLGPRDRFNRKTREYVAAMQDPVSGLWPAAAEDAVEVTFFALLLLMRGG